MAKASKKAAPKKETEPAKKASTKPAEKDKKQPLKKSGEANQGLKAPLTPSPALAEVIGSEPVPRTEIIKKIWDYIKQHGLQDQNNKRMINADDKLKEIFEGKDQISMFELAKVVNNHVKK